MKASIREAWKNSTLLINKSLLTLKRKKVVAIVQSESSECGLACLAMISTFYGHRTSLIELRKQFTYSLNGSNLSALIKTANSLRLIGRALRIDMHELIDLTLPCILHLDFNHFVVLERVSRDKAIICDPALGRLSLSTVELSRRFSGVVLELSPRHDYQKKDSATSLKFADFARGTRGIVPAILRIFAFALLLECLALASPLLMQFVIDGAIQDHDPSLLFTLALSFGLVLALQALVSMIKSRAALSISIQLSTGWNSNIFSHLLSLPENYFTKRSIGDIESRYNAAQQIQDTLTTRLVAAALDTIMTILSFGILLFYSVTLTSIAVAALCTYIAIKAIFYAKMKRIGYGQITAAARQQSLFIESVRGSTVIRMNNMRASHLARYVNAIVATNNANLKAQLMAINFDAIHTFIFGMMRIGLLCLGATYALSKNFTAGMLISFLAYNDQFGGRSTSLVDFIFQLKLLRIQSDRISDIVLTAPELNLKGTDDEVMVVPSIECKNVSFRYSDQEPWILRNCSFRVAAGEFVAVTGPSGCGKSTLVKLLAGLLDPTYGEILFDGVCVSKLGKEALRDQLTAVLQDDILFAGTISENISFFDPSETSEDVENAAVQAAIHEDIHRMPMRYQTLVGDMGSSLSGGQKQRICLARAIYRRPKILLLDEATSHLDLARERKVFSSVSKMRITRIMVAHRPETVSQADREIHLANGQAKESDPLLI